VLGLKKCEVEDEKRTVWGEVGEFGLGSMTQPDRRDVAVAVAVAVSAGHNLESPFATRPTSNPLEMARLDASSRQCGAVERQSGRTVSGRVG
jgi:hypothetical protein